MRRVAVLATTCFLLTACSTRALRPREDVWDIAPYRADSAVIDARTERPAELDD